MSNNILILGTIDTKSEQIKLLSKYIHEMGGKAFVMDLSMGSIKTQWAHITSDELIKAVGEDIETFRNSKDRKRNTGLMVKAAKEILPKVIQEHGISCVGAIGGVTMANMASEILGSLPFGMPKAIMVTAAMPSYISKWFNAMDVAVFQSVVEFNGINKMVEHALMSFGGALCGMSKIPKLDLSNLPYPSIAITELGFCQNCAHLVQNLLEERGFHVYSFHAQGISDRKMEELLRKGHFNGIIDIATGGLIEELYGGSRAAGKERLDYVFQSKVPKVLAPAALNITNLQALSGKKRKGGKALSVDELRSYIRYSKQELRKAAQIYAEKLNRAIGPLCFLFPKKGWSSLDRQGSILHDPEGDKVFVEELRRNLTNDQVQIIEVDCHLEDRAFAEILVETFLNSFSWAT